MKPLHVGLLVIGAALAGALAVRMSRFSPIEVAPVHASQPQASTASVAPKASPPVNAPPAQDEPEPGITSAPPAVYEEPAHAEPRRVEAKPEPKPRVETARMETPKPAPLSFPPATYQPAPEPPKVAEAPTVPAPSQPEPAPVAQPEPQFVAESPAPQPRRVTLAQGVPVAVRLMETLSTDHVSPGDTFQATLAEPLVAEGLIVAERGARVTGRVVAAKRAGRFGGASEIDLALATIQTADGQRVAVSTEPWVRQGQSAGTRDAEKIGGGAALGAIIGAIAGGGVGAAIGAGAGGAVGAGASAVSNGKPLSLPTESVIRFRLASRVTITERSL